MGLLPRIPRRWLMSFISLMSRLTFVLLWKYRRRMEENLEKALGDHITDPRARKRLVRRAWNNFALGVLDTMAVMHMSKEQIAASIAVEGEEHLKRALGVRTGKLSR